MNDIKINTHNLINDKISEIEEMAAQELLIELIN